MSFKSVEFIVALLKERNGKPKKKPLLWRPYEPLAITKNDHGRVMVSVSCDGKEDDFVLAFYPDRINIRDQSGKEITIHRIE